METTVTGVFADAQAAQLAKSELEREGFAESAIEELTRDTPGLHDKLGAETSDGARGAIFGAAVSAAGMAIGGIAVARLYDVHWLLCALIGALIGAVSGAMVGWFVGAITGHQVTEGYEAELHRGGELIAVKTDGTHAAKALQVLERCGGTGLSTSVHATTVHARPDDHMTVSA